MGGDVPTLSIDEAWRLPETNLRERFWRILAEVEELFGDEVRATLAGRHRAKLTRAEMIDIIERRQDWFFPEKLRGDGSSAR